MNRSFDTIDIVFIVLILIYLATIIGLVIYWCYDNGLLPGKKVKLKVKQITHRRILVIDIIHKDSKKKKTTKKKKTMTKKTKKEN